MLAPVPQARPVTDPPVPAPRIVTGEPTCTAGDPVNTVIAELVTAEWPLLGSVQATAMVEPSPAFTPTTLVGVAGAVVVNGVTIELRGENALQPVALQASISN